MGMPLVAPIATYLERLHERYRSLDAGQVADYIPQWVWHGHCYPRWASGIPRLLLRSGPLLRGQVIANLRRANRKLAVMRLSLSHRIDWVWL